MRYIVIDERKSGQLFTEEFEHKGLESPYRVR